MASGVQFIGVDEVVQAYTNKRMPAFAIWCGRDMQFRYDGTDPDQGYLKPTLQEGAQLLNDYLSGMWQGSTALYVLKVYDGLKPNEKIKPSTEYDTAFNFKLFAAQNEMINGMQVYGKQAPVLAALQKIEDRLTVIEQGPDPDEEETITEAVIGMIKEPARLSEFVSSLREIAELGRSVLTGQPMQPARIGTVKRAGQPATALTDDQLMRIGNAIEVLGKFDHAITDHLEKLAKLAETNTTKFLSIVSMIDLL